MVQMMLLIWWGSPAKPPLPKDPSVNITFRLIESTNGGSGKYLTMTVSIYNNTDDDLFIPMFNEGPYFAGVHLGRKTGEDYKDIDIQGQSNGREVYFIPQDRTLARRFDSSAIRFRKQQDSLIRAFCLKTNQDTIIWLKFGNRPLLLKAHGSAENIWAYDLSFMQQRPNAYKIYYKAAGAPEETLSPRQIEGYKRIDPAIVHGNTIYYQSIQN